MQVTEKELIEVLRNPEEIGRFVKRKESILEKYRNFIKEARRQGLSYRVIAEILRKKARIKVSESAVRKFCHERLGEPYARKMVRNELAQIYENITLEQKRKATAARREFEQDYADYVFVKEAYRRGHSQEEIKAFLMKERQDKDEGYISRTINKAISEIGG